ncbi:putative ferric-chelate reductase 1 [Betta splendens]|uniref:Ferric-chelate reductase 1 n=1 Tax=Betta splendens TaxID=158456 RepID=A0A9W2XRH5_BETSP|nr:putative ferric-chelate reductase 1 [Betta splendens]
MLGRAALLLLCFTPAAWCFPSGQVTASCDSMVPQHGANAQTSASPYTVIVDRTSFNVGDQVPVQIQGTGSNTFKGFLLKATQVGSQTAVGSFSVSTTSAQLLACSQKTGSAVAHTSGAAKSFIQAIWTPDSSGSGKTIQFSTTFVQSKSVFWVAVQSPVLTFNGNFTGGSSAATTQTPSIVKAHGSLMLISWMTTGTLGMLVARYMKGMSKGNKMFGKDLWFVVHVPLMFLTVAATIIAFIIIFVYAQDWAGGAHPVLGCLVMILAFIQPIIAFMRCEPQDPRRYVFNWAHSLNALVIKVLAVAAIFTGLQLIDGSDSQWMVKTMSGFAAWECLFYIFMEARLRWKTHNPDRTRRKTNMNGLLVGVYFLGNIAFLIALLVGIGQATVVP